MCESHECIIKDRKLCDLTIILPGMGFYTKAQVSIISRGYYLTDPLDQLKFSENFLLLTITLLCK